MKIYFVGKWLGLDWTGLDWTGLDWTGSNWTGMIILTPNSKTHLTFRTFLTPF